MTVDTVFVVAVAIHVFLASLSIIAVVRDDSLTRFQRSIQALIALLVPIFGPMFILTMLVSFHSRADLKGLLPYPLYLLAKEQTSNSNRCDSMFGGDTSGSIWDGDGD